LLVRGYKGKEADRLMTRIDPGVVSRVAELRGYERQAAEELGRGRPAAVTVALLLSDEELDSLEKGARDGEIAGADDQVDQMSQALNRAPWSVLPKYSPPIVFPPRRSRVGGVICWRPIRARGKGIVPDPSGTDSSGVQPRIRNTGESADAFERRHHWWHGDFAPGSETGRQLCGLGVGRYFMRRELPKIHVVWG